jgi:hypothetical protein
VRRAVTGATRAEACCGRLPGRGQTEVTKATRRKKACEGEVDLALAGDDDCSCSGPAGRAQSELALPGPRQQAREKPSGEGHARAWRRLAPVSFPALEDRCQAQCVSSSFVLRLRFPLRLASAL